jgi:Spy/CpxP family protein refolding chaperone
VRGRPGRTFLSIVLALLAGYCVSSRVVAGDQAPGSVAPKQTRRQSNRSTIDERASRFARNLDLTEAQQASVKKILEQQRQEILRIRNDPSIAGSAGIDRVRALQEKTVERIRAVLNEEQKKKYDPLAPRKIPPTPQPSVEDWLKKTTAQ